jgi:peptide/nickel transport system ATP-binding protein
VDRDQALAPIPGQVPALDERLAGCAFAPRCRLRRPVCDARDPPPSAPGGAGRMVRCWVRGSAEPARAAGHA